MKKFTTKVTLVDGFSDVAKIYIDWGYEITEKSWGISDLVPVVPEQTVEYDEEVEVPDPQSADGVRFEVQTKELVLKDLDIEMSPDVHLGPGISIAPSEVVIDSRRKTAKVVFEIQ
jgi:hypothetical protein